MDRPSATAWPNQGADGRFLPGNRAAVTHALDAAQLPPEFKHLAADLEQFIAGCVTDEGDEAEVSTRRRALLNYRARVHRRILHVDGALELHGLFSKDGKLRVAWLQRLEGLITQAVRLDSLLGLARRAKRVPSLNEYLEQRDQLTDDGGAAS